jgi:SAM-dependent methyltransferase
MTTSHEHHPPEPTTAPTSSIFDPEDPFEQVRLQRLDGLMNRILDHPLAGFPSALVAHLGTVLDLACGPGGWVLDVAFSHPHMEVAGVDISQGMIKYAQACARTQKVRNASFGVMDLRDRLDFSDATFDLINGRFLSSVLNRAQWKTLLLECARLLKPGGVMRLTDTESSLPCTSQALTRLNGWLTQAMHQAGYGFMPPGVPGAYIITPCLPLLLKEAGFEELQFLPYVIDCSTSSPEGLDCRYLAELTYGRAKLLICEQGLSTLEEVEQTWQQAASEMRSPDFCGLIYGLTVWGFKREEGAGADA